MPKASLGNPITIIVTSPIKDEDSQQEDWCPISSNTSSRSLSSQSSTSSLDTTRLMPPSIITLSTQSYPESGEAPEVKKWLIGCMNRKANTLPRKSVYRMMELYNIKEHDLDPKMLDKLREGIEDEGVVLHVDVEEESFGDKEKKEFDGVEVLRCLRTSFPSQDDEKEKRGGKKIAVHPNDTITRKRGSRNNKNSKATSSPSAKIITPGNRGANPRVWEKTPRSHSRNCPTNNASFPYPPYTNGGTTRTLKHHTSSKSYSTLPSNSPYIHTGKNTASSPNLRLPHHSKGTTCPPPKGSTTSLPTIPEHDVSTGALEFEYQQAKPKHIRSLNSKSPKRTSTSTSRHGPVEKRETEQKKSKKGSANR